MESRIQIDKLEPTAYRAMYSLEKYLANCNLSKTHKNLIKIRASQINDCAYCIQMHTQEALDNGETKERLFLLGSWNETDMFSEEEKTILLMTEEITLIHKKGLSTETYKKATKIFDENYMAQIIMTITTINAWNRIAVSTHKPLDN